jgi:hypothetical protein
MVEQSGFELLTATLEVRSGVQIHSGSARRHTNPRETERGLISPID